MEIQLLPEHIIIFAFVFIFGTIIGSFLNVVIYRLPRGESLAFPASHCPHCNRPIKPYENVPLFSFLFLRGRCAGCKARISWQYPAVELLTGLLFAAMLWKFGLGIEGHPPFIPPAGGGEAGSEFVIYIVLVALLIALSGIDIATMRLPNVLTLSGAVAAVALTLLLRREFWLEMILGGVVGFVMLYLMGLIGKLLFRKETLGLGDVKLAGMIGLFVGPAHTAGMYIIAIFMGAIVGLSLIIAGGRKWGEKIPFGPYLAAGVIVSLLWGEKLWRWYVSLAFR